MSPSLAGQVAIVTGGASGLGRGIVEGFIKAGAEVVIADVNDKLGQDLAHSCGPRAHYSHADVANADNVSTLILETTERLGGLDVMVNNAGISTRMHRSFLEDDLADFSKVMAVNLFGVMLGTRESARYMSTHGGGAIINIASIGGLQAGGGVMTYRASKAAVIHFSKSVATELGPKGISVNCIAPGDSNAYPGIFSTRLRSQRGGRRQIRGQNAYQNAQRPPLPHEGTPEDVAEAALYLAASPGTTGAVLTVDGGTSATA